MSSIPQVRRTHRTQGMHPSRTNSGDSTMKRQPIYSSITGDCVEDADARAATDGQRQRNVELACNVLYHLLITQHEAHSYIYSLIS